MIICSLSTIWSKNVHDLATNLDEMHAQVSSVQPRQWVLQSHLLHFPIPKAPLAHPRQRPPSSSIITTPIVALPLNHAVNPSLVLPVPIISFRIGFSSKNQATPLSNQEIWESKLTDSRHEPHSHTGCWPWIAYSTYSRLILLIFGNERWRAYNTCMLQGYSGVRIFSFPQACF